MAIGDFANDGCIKLMNPDERIMMWIPLSITEEVGHVLSAFIS